VSGGIGWWERKGGLLVTGIFLGDLFFDKSFDVCCDT
jgi:hypothetical protein